MKPLKIVVLCGGLSTERNISFLTGTRVCAALRGRGHKAVLVDLYLGIEDRASGAFSDDLTQYGDGASGAFSEGLTQYGEGAAEAFRGSGVFDPEVLFETLPPVPAYFFDGQAPDLEAVRRSRKWDSPSIFGRHVLELCAAADIVFIALHGKNGEDGRVQATFDMLGIPYTGSGHLGAAMAMDKMITKMVVGSRGVRTPAFRRWDFSEAGPDTKTRAGQMDSGQRGGREQGDPEGENGTEKIGREQTGSEKTGTEKTCPEKACPEKTGSEKNAEPFRVDSDAETAVVLLREAFIRSVCRQTDVPCVVKTPDGGSSVGVYIVRKKEDLEKAVRGCLAYGDVFMTEQFIEGREFTCGVLCGQALPSVEIVPKTRFYDYSNKYAAGATEEICPGRCSPQIEKEIGQTALKVHEIMGLSTYSRSDFMIDKEDRVWFIEVNTLPGMTGTSLVPQEAAAVGISYEDLCEKIVEDGLRLRASE